MKKLVSPKLKNKKVIILIVVLSIIIISILSVVTGNVIRKSKINKQALNNINEEEKYTTIFCSGQNVTLNKSIYSKLKEEGYDLLIYNDNYMARIDNAKLENKINLSVITLNYNELANAYSIELNSNIVKEISVKNPIVEKDYVSEFALKDKLEFINNDTKVDECGYIDIKLKDNVNKYVVAYIIPENIKVEDMEINKGATKRIELAIEKEQYTLGSVNVTCSDKDAIEIDSEHNIKANKVGEYTLIYTTDTYTKEAKLKINPSVEKIDLDKTTIELVEGGSETITVTITPDDAVNKELKWTSSDENVAQVENGKVTGVGVGNCEIVVSTTSEPKVEVKVFVEVKEKPSLSSLLTAPNIGQIPGATYINGILLVNKTHSIPADYAPGLNSQAYQAYLQLKNDAYAAGYDIPLLSGYRSYETQRNLYNNYCATYGQAEADTFSARPGTSEHQTGLAMDIGQIEDWYGDTAAGQWLAQNCYKYGFIIRYPKGKEHITGYKYEPWHVRYLGVDIATKVYNSGLTLEEYLGAN